MKTLNEKLEPVQYVLIQKKLSEIAYWEGESCVNKLNSQYLTLQKRLLYLITIAEKSGEGNYVEEVEGCLYEVQLMINFLHDIGEYIESPNKEATEELIQGYIKEFLMQNESVEFCHNLQKSLIKLHQLIFRLLTIEEKENEGSSIGILNDCLFDINLYAEAFLVGEEMKVEAA